MPNTTNATTKPVTNRKHPLLCFLGTIFISSVIGFLAGFLLNHLGEKNFQTGIHQLRSLLPVGAPATLLASNVIFFIMTASSFMNTKRQLKNWDGEDETFLDTLEYKLDFPLLWTNIAMVLNFALFAISMDALFTANKKTYFVYLSAGCILCLLAGLAWICFFQHAIIELCKNLNPEKRGNFFAPNFQKQWVDSCDEAQKIMIYRSGYNAFQVVNITCILLWVITFTTNICLHTGIFPVICVCIIYFAATLSYTLYAIKEEKH